MTKGEYFEIQVNNQIKEHQEEISIKLKEYMKNNKEKIIIDEKIYSLFKLLDYFNAPHTFFVDDPVYKIDNEKALIPINNNTKKIFEENLSSSVKELKCPISFLEKINVLTLTNLKKLSIDNNNIINKQQLEFVLGKTNIDELATTGTFDDEILKDSVFIDYYNYKEGFYKGKSIKSGMGTKNILRGIYSKNPYQEIETITKLLNNIDFNNNSIKICNDLDMKNIVVEIKKNEDKCHLTINQVKNISDVEYLLSELEKNNYEIGLINLNLENKTYDDIIKLKFIEKKYNLKINYSNSLLEANAEDFIMMRSTIDYYKELILENDLSPLEKATYAYDLIKSFKYEEVKEDEDKAKSRNIHSIIKEGKIVCVGYATFYAQLMKELGIDGYAFSTIVPIGEEKFGHERTILNIKDSKYGINGSYAFDPTWDSAKNVVKVIDEQGKEKLKSLYDEELKDNEKIIKTYNDLQLYRYFLVSRENYQKKFVGEKMPMLYKDNYYGNEEITKDNISDNQLLDKLEFPIDKFKTLIANVKICEGFKKEEIAKLLDEIIEVNGFENKIEQLEESAIKR